MSRSKKLVLRLFLAGSAFVLSLVFAPTVFAQSSTTKLGSPVTIGTPEEQTSSLKVPDLHPPKAKINGYLRFETMKYPTEIPESPQLDQSMLLSTNFKLDYDSTYIHNGLDVTAGRYVDLGGSTYAVREIYSSWKISDTTTLSAGRKLEFWSKVDEDWALGLWQPSYVMDGLRPEDQGLTGLFVQTTTGDFDFLGFATPYFIPTMGPDIQEKNGTLVSQSRWYRQPSSSFPLRGKSTKLVYALEVPALTDLVTNGGAGARASWRKGQKGFWAGANYAYKPINSLLLKYKTSLFLPEEDPQTGEVTVSPAVGYHRLYGGDFGYQFETSTLTFSYLEDRPEKQRARDNWVLQNPNAMKVYGIHYGTAAKIPFVFESVQFKLNYLRITDGTIQDYDALGQEQGAIFDTRTNFSNAASAEVGIPTQVFGKKLLSKFKYMREFEQSGVIINTEFNYFPQKALALTVGADMLGPDDAKNSNTDTRFINQFRANDRYYGGLSYVF